MTWGAVAIGVGSAVAGVAGSQAAGKAADSQTAAAQAGIDAQMSQFRQIQGLLAPYAQAGSSQFDAEAYLRQNPDVAADPYFGQNPYEHYLTRGAAEGRAKPMTAPGALQGQQDLLGLNGVQAQQTAITNIENSPYFSGLVKQGEKAILQNASATGGLRGGNTQAALAQFRPNMLAAAIDQQYQRLGGLTSIGQNAAAGVGNAGLTTGNNVAGLLQQSGAATAGGYLASGRAIQQGLNGITNAFGTYQGMQTPVANSGGITGTGGATGVAAFGATPPTTFF